MAQGTHEASAASMEAGAVQAAGSAETTVDNSDKGGKDK
jgi:hypothetical protein